MSTRKYRVPLAAALVPFAVAAVLIGPSGGREEMPKGEPEIAARARVQERHEETVTDTSGTETDANAILSKVLYGAMGAGGVLAFTVKRKRGGGPGHISPVRFQQEVTDAEREAQGRIGALTARVLEQHGYIQREA